MLLFLSGFSLADSCFVVLTITFQDSGTIARRQGFLPLLSDVPQQRQTKPVSTDESSIPPALRNLNEKRLDLPKGGHATGHTFLPLLPGRGIDSSKREVPNHGTNTGSFPPRLSSAGVLNAKRPSQEHREHLAEGAAQENHVRLARSAPVNCYEWPLIINGVYQGEGPLPPCQIEDNASPTEPRPYAWPHHSSSGAFRREWRSTAWPKWKRSNGECCKRGREG